MSLSALCDVALVLMLERVQDRDLVDEWLASELQYVDPDRQELNMALGLSGA